jgi:hypothetical protein
MDSIAWLLSDSNPSVRYWTLRDILDTPDNDLQVQKAQKAISQYDVVTKIFSLQKEEGFWGDPKNLWNYKNTGFNLLLLSELGLKRDMRIEKAVEFLFNFQQEDGHFTSRGKPSKVATNDFCLTGMFLKLLLQFEYCDARVKNARDFLVSTEADGWRCGYYPQEKEKVFPETCYMGGIKVLGAFAKLPPHLVTAAVKDIIERYSEIYLENRIYWYRKDKNGNRTKKPSWTRFAFPLFWQSDALEVLDVLTELGVRDERMHQSLELVQSKQVEGRWILERSFTGGIVHLGDVGHPSKWITMRALRVLKRAGYCD